MPVLPGSHCVILMATGERVRAYFHVFIIHTHSSITTTFALQAGLLQDSAKPPFPLADAVIDQSSSTVAAGYLNSRRLKHNQTVDDRGYANIKEKMWVLHCILLHAGSTLGTGASTPRIHLLVLV